MVKTVMAIEREREIEDAQSIRDTGASGKRKKDQPSSSLGKKQKTSIPKGFQGWVADIRTKAISGLLASQDQ